MFAPTKGLSHFGTFTLEKAGKRKAIYEFSIADKDGDSGTGHFSVNKRGKIAFYGEEGNDDSKLSKDDPLLFKSDLGDAFDWGDIIGGGSTLPIENVINTIGHYGTIAAKGLDTADTIFDALSDFSKTSGLFKRSDNFSIGDLLSGVETGINISGKIINTVAPIVPFLL